MEISPAVVEPEPVDLDPCTKRKSRSASKPIRAQLAPHPVIVPEAKPEIFSGPDEQFATKDKMSEKIVNPLGKSAGLFRFFS